MPRPAAKKILIVDDERDLVRPLALRLSAGGRYEVAVAFGGLEGFERAVACRPDIALVDLSMPGVDGWDLCRRLREDPRTRGTEVVIMTAWLSPDLGRRAAAEGVKRLLLKPFEEADLFSALESAEALCHEDP